MENLILQITTTASAAVKARQFVSPVGGAPAAGGNTLGVAWTKAADGENLTVGVLGTATVIAAAAVAKGAALMVDTDGKVLTKTGDKVTVVCALSAASGDGKELMRVADPVLTNIARGYKQAELVGHHLFPMVPVSTRGRKIVEFGKEDFRTHNTVRTPGADTQRIQFGHSGKDFALTQHALEAQVPREWQEDLRTTPGMDASRRAINGVMAIIKLRLESDQAKLARDADKYSAGNKVALAGNSKFSHKDSTPHSVIDAAREAVRAKIGRYPNTMVLGPKVYTALRRHSQVIEQTKYVKQGFADMGDLAEQFDIEHVYVGKAVSADEGGAFSNVWGGDIVAAYTNISGLSDMGEPSFGYTYQLSGYPMVEKSYWDERSKSHIHPVTDECTPVIAGANAGYLIQAAV